MSHVIKTVVCDHPHWNDYHVIDLVKYLIKEGVGIRTAESCTGCGIVNTFTNIDGSSKIIDFALLTYSPEVKQKILGVPVEWTTDETIVSSTTCELMNEGLAKFCRQFTNENDYVYVTITGWIGSCPMSTGDTVFFTLSDGSPDKKLIKTFELSVDKGSNKADKKGLIIHRIILEIIDFISD